MFPRQPHGGAEEGGVGRGDGGMPDAHDIRPEDDDDNRRDEVDEDGQPDALPVEGFEEVDALREADDQEEMGQNREHPANHEGQPAHAQLGAEDDHAHQDVGGEHAAEGGE